MIIVRGTLRFVTTDVEGIGDSKPFQGTRLDRTDTGMRRIGAYSQAKLSSAMLRVVIDVWRW